MKPYYICFVSFEQYAFEQNEDEERIFVITDLKHEIQTTNFQLIKMNEEHVVSSETIDHALITALLNIWNGLESSYKNKINQETFRKYVTYHTGSVVHFKV